MKVVGTRLTDTSPMADQAGLAKTAALLRGTEALAPRGVYRFSSFEEADAWMTQTILRTHARLSRKTGFAVIAHGASRFTKDIDLLVDDAPENISRVKHGLSILADNTAAEVAKDTYRPQDTIDRSFLQQILERRRGEA